MNVLSENDAALAFARAWNRLEPEVFLSLLAPDARYASQWVFEEMIGAQAISKYLSEKMKTVGLHSAEDLETKVRVEIGRLAGTDGRSCAFMSQGFSDDIQAAVLFEVKDGKVSRYDLCLPQLVGAVRTGIFPE